MMGQYPTLFISNLHLIGTPLLPNNFVLIREVSFGVREYYMYSEYLLPKICVLFYRGVHYRDYPLRQGPLYNYYVLYLQEHSIYVYQYG